MPFSAAGGDVFVLDVGDALMVWDFCNAFSAQIQLAPFSLDVLLGALLCSEEAPFVAELHLALLSVDEVTGDVR